MGHSKEGMDDGVDGASVCPACEHQVTASEENCPNCGTYLVYLFDENQKPQNAVFTPPRKSTPDELPEEPPKEPCKEIVETPLPSSPRSPAICPHCNNPHSENARFCPKCGRALEEPSLSHSPSPPTPLSPARLQTLVPKVGLLFLMGLIILISLATLYLFVPGIQSPHLNLTSANTSRAVIPDNSTLVTEPLVTSTITTSSPSAFLVSPFPTQLPQPWPELGSTTISPQDGMTMVYIPAGEFIRGLNQEQIETFLSLCSECEQQQFQDAVPYHLVYLDDFWIYQTEVTNEMYQKCVNTGFCSLPVQASSQTRSSYYGNHTYATYPVVFVNWSMANQYCQWAGGRLPTEAEWEKAARGTDGRLFPWGNQAPNPKVLNTYTYVGDTVPVGTYPEGASPYGVLDLAGNVYEWIADWYLSTYFQLMVYDNPQGPGVGEKGRRVVRGGSWGWGVPFVSAAYRDCWEPEKIGSGVGFRCVMDTPASPTAFPSDIPTITLLPTSSATATPTPNFEPVGRIVFTCYIDSIDHICSMNADGNNQQRLTHAGATDFYASWSPDGRGIIFSSRRDGSFQLYTMSADGEHETRLSYDLGTGGLFSPAYSPDGSRIVFTRAAEDAQNIWIMNADASDGISLTNTIGNNVDPVWSPDGSQIAFSSDRSGITGIYIMDANGENQHLLYIGVSDMGGRIDWSPDGHWIAFYAGPRGSRNIYLVAVDGSYMRQLTFANDNLAPSFSRDGNWIAYTSTQDGDHEIFIIRTDGSEVRQLTQNTRPDWQPRWGP